MTLLERLRANETLLWQTAGLIAAILPHLLRQSALIGICFLLLVTWRLMGSLYFWPLPGPRQRVLSLVKNGIAVGIFIGMYLLYGRQLGREAGVSLLVVLSALKLLEMREDRDRYLVAFLGYFLVITNFFYTQNLLAGAYMLVSVWLITAGLIALNDKGGRLRHWPYLRVAGQMLAQALPLTLVAFILFPRIPGPLWGLPKDAYAGLSGLSEEMSPGNISQLSLSDAPAFRVEFVGTPPSPAERYWRGPVLTRTDGRTWTRSEQDRLWPPTIHAEGARQQYTVTLEPHNQRWLFLLELPAVYPNESIVTRDVRVLTRRPVTQRLRYTAQSYTHSRIVQADDEDLAEALQLPRGMHPRALALARQWREQSVRTEDIVRRAMTYFRQQPFFYSLSPSPIEGDSVDDFLFNTRRGFCEHYAATFAVLMRAAGIPARVVTGYQGGEYNPVGGYLLVRSRDAHAWTEVWIRNRGWVRVDPTAAVAPSRIERGIDQVMPPTFAGIPAAFEENAAFQGLWRTLRNVADAVDNRWNQWVLGYNARRQSELLSRLGMETDWASLTLWLTGAGALVMAIVAALMLASARARRDPARAAYDRFCAKLARAGLTRLPHEGPLDFAQRAARRFPAAAGIEAVTALYVGLRYAGRRVHIDELSRAVRAFRL